MPKTRRKSDWRKQTFSKNKDSDNPGQKSWDSTAIFIFFCYFSVLSLLKQCSVFEILLQFSLPPPYTKLKLGIKTLDTGVQHVIFCRRTLHFCDRYPFSLLVKSVSAVSGRDFMVVKLLLYFFCVCFAVCFFFVVFICFCFVLFCFLFSALFGYLYVVVFVFCFCWSTYCC